MNKIYKYKNLIDLLIHTRSINYDCTDLSDHASLFFFYSDEINSNEENEFFIYYSDLMHYFVVESGTDSNFKQVIDDLIGVIEKRKLINTDISYILNKNEIIKMINKFTTNKISKDILIRQLKKYFKINNFDEIQSYLLTNNIQIII